MFNERFGQYLVEQHYVTQQQLLEVLAYERNVRLKIGVMAVNAGLMTADQVEEVCAEQRAADKWFGQIAIEKGYLTADQFEDLLKTQGKGFLSLSQTVLEKGYLTLNQLQTALERYKNAANLSDVQWQALQTMDFDRIVRSLLDFSAAGNKAQVYYDYTAIMLRSMVRFLNEEAILSGSEKMPDVLPGWVVSQDITGEWKLFTALHMENACLLHTANCYSKEGFTAAEPLVGDCVAEFLNIVNGIFCAAASDGGRELLMRPQRVRKNIAVANRQGYIIPLGLSFGRLDLVLGVSDEAN